MIGLNLNYKKADTRMVGLKGVSEVGRRLGEFA